MEPLTTIEALEERLSRPSSEVVQLFRELPGDILFLGAAGKIGPSLARMARRAADGAGGSRRIIAVSRFSNPAEIANFARHGIETIQCDLLDPAAVNALPDAPNVIFLAGSKFGGSANPGAMWAINAFLPGLVAQKYSRSRIAALSTGNVYGLASVQAGGARETDLPAPIGEYAASCLGRERLFDYFSAKEGTSVALIRLFYACELRYGVLVDVARKVYDGLPVDVSMGWFNAIWQQDSNRMTLLALRHAASPLQILNLTGLEMLRVRDIATRFGELFGRKPEFTGTEAPNAVIGNMDKAAPLLGPPEVSVDEMIPAIAAWIQAGGASLGKPTHFETRDGKY